MLEGSTPFLERIRQTLLAVREHPESSPFVDLAALLRQWLLRNIRRSDAPWISVPRQALWPSSDFWRQQDFEVASLPNSIEICPNQPRLTWLNEQSDLFDDVFEVEEARTLSQIPADPFVRSKCGVTSYTGHGQREAIRALLHLPSDVTLIANLPTGSGKSLLAQLPALASSGGTLTLVIVPTVALAIDQGRRMAELLREQDFRWLERPLAYHSGLSSDERKMVFQGLREGEQRVLFTSPEAATGTLRRTLIDCARLGRVTHVVIDEAHLVVTWGSGFRPAFQLLPALISSLRAAHGGETPQPIRVVLASATLTAHTVTSLQAQFVPLGATVSIVSDIQLRPEPRYAVRYCHSSSEKTRLVLEAVKKAPRPYILYVTRPEEAEDWLLLLRQEGFKRVAAFTGETSPQDRQRLMSQWSVDQLDGMVATSAFGLGVDKNDVRCVIHATLPESLDRFYQEVGRGGRDGKASASVLIFAPEDIPQARDMAFPTLIGNKKGYERWVAMLDKPIRANSSHGGAWLDLNRLRPFLNTRGKGNRGWNLRALNLMAAAGLIEVTAFSARPPGVADEVDMEYDETQVSYAEVGFLCPQHRQLEFFATRMNEARQKMQDASAKAFRLMYQTATGEIEISDALTKLYALSLPNHWGPVTQRCGGCAFHWGPFRALAINSQSFVGRIDRFSPRGQSLLALANLPYESPHLVFITVHDLLHACATPRSILEVLVDVVRPHTVLLSLSAAEIYERGLQDRIAASRSDTFLDRFNPRVPSALYGGTDEVRFIIWTESTISSDVVAVLRAATSGLTVVFFHPSLADPYRPDRPWSDIVLHVDEETALRRIML